MNAELVESLVQVIQTLPSAEQSMLKQRLAHNDSPPESNLITQYTAILRPLIAAGQLMPPPQKTTNSKINEREFRTIVEQIQISGPPLSETVIEDRGEW
jgi:hypothetical protein